MLGSGAGGESVEGGIRGGHQAAGKLARLSHLSGPVFESLGSRVCGRQPERVLFCYALVIEVSFVCKRDMSITLV